MAPTVGWQILLDEDEWEKDAPAYFSIAERAPSSQANTNSWASWTVAGIVLCLALAVSVHLQQRFRTGLAATQKSLSHTLALESQASEMGDELLATALLDPQADTAWQKQMLAEMERTDGRGADKIELIDFVLQGDRAIAQVRVTDAETDFAFRESRFYRETAGGWLRSQPEPTLWGSPDTLESGHFVFHFRQRDGAAVAEAAPVLDAVYLHIHTALGLLLSATPDATTKVQVYVAVDGAESMGDLWAATARPVQVPSPQLIRLPEQVSEGDALAGLVSYSLHRRLINRSLSLQGKEYQLTSEFLSGLHLWLVWEETPLFVDYRAELVEWLYTNAPHSPPYLQGNRAH